MRRQEGQVLDARIFPQAKDAERAILGGAIQSPRQIEECREVVQPGDFYHPQHGALWLAILHMADANENIDLVTVTNRVCKGGNDERFGGLAYVLDLHAEASAGYILHYAKIIAEKARLRRLIASLQVATDAAFAEHHAAEEITSGLLSELDSVATGSSIESDWLEWNDLIDQSFERVEAAANGERLEGYPVGLPELAEIVPRFRPGQLIIVGARPAMGKTSLAMGFAKQIASQGAVVAVFALEMEGSELAMGDLARVARRVDAYEKGIPIGILDGMSARELAEGRIGDASWSALTDARELAKAPSMVASSGAASMDDIEARVRRLARWGKAKGVEIGAVVVDYLGLIMRKQRGGQTDASAIAEITERMKRLAKSTRLAIICLAQLNRQCEQREDKRPRMSDLRDSGGIEQDADVVMFVYRDVVYNPDASPHEAEIIVAKQRNGRTGTAEVRWAGQSTEFYSEREQTHKLGGYEDFMRTGGL